MKKFFIMTMAVFLLSGFLLSHVFCAEAQDEPRIEVTLGREQIYEGESVAYLVSVVNLDPPVKPTLEGFDDFEVTYQGESSRNSSHMTIVNGRMTRSARYCTDYRYDLVPKKTGRLRIPAPFVDHDGEKLRGRSLMLKVVGAEAQDVAVMEITSTPAALYPLQPFTVTLKIWIRTLPPPYEERDPLAVQQDPPMLSIPWADIDLSKSMPDIEPETDANKWLDPLIARTVGFERGAGFGINSYATSSIWSQESLRFKLKHKKTERPDLNGEMQKYRIYTLERTFIPQRAGSYLFGPVTLKGTFATDTNPRNNKLMGEDIFAIGKAITVNVRDVPAEGQPDSYTGAIGNFDFQAGLAPLRARVGDPMTLTLTLKGQGTLDKARAPDLTQLPEIADRFKVYEATEETRGKMRTFTYSLRPKSADFSEFPSVPFSYFDVSRERYVTLNSEAIPVQIDDTEQLADDDIITRPREEINGAKRIEARKEGVFANITDLNALRDETVRMEWVVGILAGMVVSYLLASVGLGWFRKVSGDEALQRRRGARSKARDRLNEGTALMKGGDPLQGTDKVRAAFTGLVADACNVPEAGLTLRDVKERLGTLGIDATLVDRIWKILEQCDGARFGAIDGLDAAPLAEESDAAMKEVLQDLKRQGRLK